MAAIQGLGCHPSLECSFDESARRQKRRKLDLYYHAVAFLEFCLGVGLHFLELHLASGLQSIARFRVLRLQWTCNHVSCVCSGHWLLLTTLLVRRLGPKERVSLLRAKSRCRNPHAFLYRNSKAWIDHITGLDSIVTGLFGAQEGLLRTQVGPFGMGDSLR